MAGPKVLPRFVQTRLGEVHLTDAGEGPPLLLLHSVGCSAQEFEDVMERLAREHRVLAWDMPGHGDSGPLSRSLRIEDYAEALVECLDDLGLAAVDLLGVSIGAHIALQAAASRPERVRSLIFVEGGLFSFEEWGDRWRLVEDTFTAMPQSLEEIAPRFRAADAGLLRQWNIDRAKAGAGAMMNAMWSLRRYRFEAPLANLTLPTLLMFGDKSPVGASLERAQAAVAHAQSVVMASCGHFPMIDDPAGFSTAVTAFLDGL